MTVSELITRLQAFPVELEVKVTHQTGFRVVGEEYPMTDPVLRMENIEKWTADGGTMGLYNCECLADDSDIPFYGPPEFGVSKDKTEIVITLR